MVFMKKRLLQGIIATSILFGFSSCNYFSSKKELEKINSEERKISVVVGFDHMPEKDAFDLFSKLQV